MQTLHVNLKGCAYDILVGSDLLPRIGELVRPLGLGRRLGLVTHPLLAETHGYASVVAAALREVGHEVCVATVPTGEESKSLDRAAQLARELVRAGAGPGRLVLDGLEGAAGLDGVDGGVHGDRRLRLREGPSA